MDDAYTLLIADGDETTRRFLGDNLTCDGYSVLEAQTVEHTLALASSHYPDALILGDLEQPRDAIDVLRQIRDADDVDSSIDVDLPVLVCSGRSDDLARLRGFDAGCDDYVAKPFSYPELRARVGALLRRANRRRAGAVRVGNLAVDPATREVTVRGEPVTLAAKEFALLRALVSDPTRVYTKQELLREVWGIRDVGSTRTLDSHACRLRKKLAAVAGDRFVSNVWGVGYRLADPPAFSRDAA